MVLYEAVVKLNILYNALMCVCVTVHEHPFTIFLEHRAKFVGPVSTLSALIVSGMRVVHLPMCVCICVRVCVCVHACVCV